MMTLSNKVQQGGKDSRILKKFWVNYCKRVAASFKLLQFWNFMADLNMKHKRGLRFVGKYQSHSLTELRIKEKRKNSWLGCAKMCDIETFYDDSWIKKHEYFSSVTICKRSSVLPDVWK